MPAAALRCGDANSEGLREEVLPQARRARLCFVAPHAWPVLARDSSFRVVGGAEVQQSLLARLLAAQGYPVSMICLDYGQPPRVEVEGVTVHRVFRADAGLPVLRFAHPRLSSMWRALREADADVYYYRSVSMWVAVMAAFCRRHGRRSIYAGASNMDFLPGQGGQIRYARDRWLFRRGLAAVDRIVVQNEAQRESCRTHYGRDAVLIPSCYQPPARSAGGEPRRERADRVLWVGTVHENKRPRLLLELARRLPGRRFVMVGGPSRGRANPFFDAVRREAEALPNVEFTGFLPLEEVERWFDRARVFVLTSAYEGMPNVFLQAWARGVPTVSTVDVGTPANIVARDVDALEREVGSLLADRARWAAASALCRRGFERSHSSTGVLERYERLFAGLVS